MNKIKLPRMLFLIFGILIFLPSCGKNDADAPNVITFWHFWSEPYQRDALLKLIDEFEIENNCEVNATELSWNDGKTKLMAAFSAKTAPDVLELGSDWLAQFTQGSLMCLDTIVDLKTYLDESLVPVYHNGKCYAVPWILDTRVMFYNKTLLQNAGINELPKTYTELINYSNSINNQEQNIYGFGCNSSDPHRLYKKILPMFWSNGGDILDKQGNPILNSLNNVQALQVYSELSRVGIIDTQRQLDALFTEGKIGFVFSGSWLVEKIKSMQSNLNYGVALVPSFTNSAIHKGISFLGGEYLAINKDSKKKELATKLIKFLADGKNAITLAKKFQEAGFPADKQYMNDNFFTKDPIKNVFLEQLKYSKMSPVHSDWLDIENIIENSVSKVIYGESDANNALNNAQMEILQLLGKNN